MAAIHRQGVLGQIVGADGKEIRLAGELRGHDRRRRDFHHDAGFNRPDAQPLPFFLQHGLGVAQFGQQADHREHHPDLAEGGGAQDRPQLGAQDFRAIQPDAQAAFAEERVFLLGNGQVNQRLVAAYVERANDQRPVRSQRLGDGLVGFELLVFVGGGAAFQEQEFRAQQSDAFAAQARNLFGFGQTADVADYFHAMAVQRDRRFVRHRHLGLPAGGQSFLGFADAGDLLRAGIQPQGALAAVENHRRAVGQFQRPGFDAGDRRDVQGAGQNGDVRGRAAQRGAETPHPVAVEAGGVGRGELLGHQNGVDRRFPALRFGPGQQGQHPPPHVAQIVGASRQQFVAQAGQSVGVGGKRPPPGELGAFALGQRRMGDVQQVGIVQQFLMGGEDGGLVGGALAVQARLQGFQLHRGLIDRLVQPVALPLRVALGGFVNLNLLMPNLEHLADRQSWRCGHAEQQVRVFRARARRGRGAGRDFDAGRRGRGLATLVAQTFPEQRGQRLDRRLGVVALGDQDYFIALADFQTHDGDHALGIGLSIAFLDADVGLEFLGEVGQHRRRAGVQAGGIGDHNRFGGDGFGRLGRGFRLGAGQGQFENDIPTGGDGAGTRGEGRHPLAVGDDDLGEQALGVGGDVIGVEVDQGVAGLDRVACLDLGGEAAALEADGVEADVHQHFDALRRGDGDGVAGRVQLYDLAVAGRAQALVERVDGDAVANHFLGEYRVGNSFDRHQRAGERRGQGEPDGG